MSRSFIIENILKFRTIKTNKISKRILAIWAGLIIMSLFSLYFITNNEDMYNKPIAKIITINEEESSKETDNGKIEPIKNQKIQAIIMNGIYKGKLVELNNLTSFSQINDLDLKINDEVFLSIEDNDKQEISSVKIIELKRDKYIVYIINIFVALILLVGGAKGFRSLASVFVNIVIVFIIIGLFTKGYDLMVFAIIASILFIVLSILIVSGRNKKSMSAIVGTLIGTIIDVSISISSSMNEIYKNNSFITQHELFKSGMNIGKDVLGTMTNTLFFAYISGFMTLLIYFSELKYSVATIFNAKVFCSEVFQSICCGIGIILIIPITAFITSKLMFLTRKSKKIGSLKK